MGEKPRLSFSEFAAIGASCVLVGGAFLPFYTVGVGQAGRFSFGVSAGLLVVPLALAAIVLTAMRLRVGAIIVLAVSGVWVSLELIAVLVLDHFNPAVGAYVMLAGAVGGLLSLAIGRPRPHPEDPLAAKE